MTDPRTDSTPASQPQPAPAPQTVIVERSGGSTGAMLIGMALLIGVVIVAYFLFTRGQNDAIETKAVTEAAQAVGEGASKVGDAAEKAGEKLTGE